MFEKRGIPAAVLITEPFRVTADAMAEMQQMPGYPYVVLPHPVTSLRPDAVRTRADAVTDAVERVLLLHGRGTDEAQSDGVDVHIVIETLAQGLRADGADLLGCLTAPGELSLELVLADETCADCILPKATLQPMFEQIVRRHLGPGYRVVLDDPRER